MPERYVHKYLNIVNITYIFLGTYEGHWKDGLQSGNGIFRYCNGDHYTGQFLSGKYHGHGVLKRGHFNSSVASIYVGNFVHGLRYIEY